MNSALATKKRGDTSKILRRRIFRSQIRSRRRARYIREHAELNGALGDCAIEYLDPERVGPHTTHDPERFCAEIFSEANNETFWLSYDAEASLLLDKFTGTCDTSSRIVWRDGTIAMVRASQNNH